MRKRESGSVSKIEIAHNHGIGVRFNARRIRSGEKMQVERTASYAGGEGS